MKIRNVSELIEFLQKVQTEDVQIEKDKQGDGKAIEEAQTKARQIILEAEERAVATKRDSEEKASRLAQESIALEAKLQDRESAILAKESEIEKEREKEQKIRENLEQEQERLLVKLEQVAGMTQTQAKDLLIKGLEDRMKGEIAKKLREKEEQIKQESETRAREILIDAIRYGAVDFTPEYTLSTIALPNDSAKGRIIGKEGRNIRAFEIATGVDVDLEEEGVIKLSSFDAVRREVARVSLEKLIKDGRIQPTRIEEIVHKTKEEVDKLMEKAGAELCQSVGVYNLPRDLVNLLGRFKYRFSYGQNMILHTLEETKIGVAIAHEVGADVNTVKLGCLLHDIGKIVDSKEGSHVGLGVELLKKYNIPQSIIHCVEAHHEDIPFESVEAVIVYIADAISGGRPGARHEDFEQYLKRIKEIEAAALEQSGVAEAYALQAGRELRVIVKPEAISDDEAVVLADKIRTKIEEKFPTFPGQVNITVIRETRASATSHS